MLLCVQVSLCESADLATAVTAHALICCHVSNKGGGTYLNHIHSHTHSQAVDQIKQSSALSVTLMRRFYVFSVISFFKQTSFTTL